MSVDLTIFGRGLTVLLQIVVGFVSTKLKIVSPKNISMINSFCFRFFLIPLILRSLTRCDFRSLNFSPFFINACGLVLTAMFLSVVFFLRTNKLYYYISSLLPVIYINYLIIGIPFFNSLWDEKTNYIVSVINLGNDMITVPFYMILQSIFSLRKENEAKAERGEEQEKFSWSSLLAIGKNVLLNPVIIANITGIVYSALRIPIPHFLDIIMAILANSVLFLGLFSVGGFLALSGSVIACPIPQFLFTLFCRCIAYPFFVSVAAKILGASGLIARQCVALSALPSATNSYIFSERYDTGPGVASTMIFATTILCIPVMVLWLFIFDKLHIFPV